DRDVGETTCRDMQQLSVAGPDQPKDACKNTPRKVCTPNSASLVTKNYDGSEILAARKKEFKRMVDNYIEYDVDGILDLAVPEDEGAKSAASALADSISALVESLCAEEDSQPTSNIAEGSRGRGRGGGKSTKARKPSGLNPVPSRSSIMSEWVSNQQQPPSAKGKSARTKSTRDIATLTNSIVEFKQWTI
ncbi:hypothetical protein EV175_004978, partial [Coemansia sp. RSA 1933]